MKIVVDAMGGDFAPSEVVKGALEAASNDPEIELIFTGNEVQIKKSIPKGCFFYIQLYWFYSTVTDFARFLGWSTLQPLFIAIWYDKSCSGIVASIGVKHSETLGISIT